MRRGRLNDAQRVYQQILTICGGPTSACRPSCWSLQAPPRPRFLSGTYTANPSTPLSQGRLLIGNGKPGRRATISTDSGIPELTSLESFANLDHDRRKRTGFPEAVFAEGKTSAQVAAILEDMARKVNESRHVDFDEHHDTGPILATRYIAHLGIGLGVARQIDQCTISLSSPFSSFSVAPTMYQELCSLPFSQGILEYRPEARIALMRPNSSDPRRSDNDRQLSLPRVVVATAGTTDLPVAEEAAVTLEASGCIVDRVYDVGVAGLHRIVKALPRLRHPKVGCVVVCAGMDGALPSVVGGLVDVPVVAVPTSIGYGASFGGVSALLTMLNSCAPGVGVVNIDNGFGAAALAYKCILQRRGSNCGGG